jgi:hypothetical protein
LLILPEPANLKEQSIRRDDLFERLIPLIVHSAQPNRIGVYLALSARWG